MFVYFWYVVEIGCGIEVSVKKLQFLLVNDISLFGLLDYMGGLYSEGWQWVSA